MVTRVEKCTHRELHIHRDDNIIHNVPKTCPFTQQSFIDPVYCKNINQVFERGALTTDFTKQYVTQLTQLKTVEVCVRIKPPQKSEAGAADTDTKEPTTLREKRKATLQSIESEIPVTPALFNRLIFYPLSKSTNPDHPDWYGIAKDPVIFSVKQESIRRCMDQGIVPKPAIKDKESINDSQIRELVTQYMDAEGQESLIAEIHKRREELGLKTGEKGKARGPDLSGLDLSNLVIKNLNLEYQVLVNTDFSNCNISNCKFNHARFMGCNFTNAIVTNCELSGHEMSFYGSSVRGANFYNNSYFYIEDDNGLRNTTVKTFEQYQEKLEFLGAVDTTLLKNAGPVATRTRSQSKSKVGI